MSTKNPQSVLDEISRERLPHDLNLMPGIAAKIEQGNRPIMNRSKILRLSALVLAVVLLIALFSVPAVAHALRGLLGYIPGVGRVDQNAQLRVLAAPVTDTRDGYTLTVQSAVLDSNRTVLNYLLAGQFPTWDDPMLRPTICSEPSFLRLPDGTKIEYPSRVGSSYPGSDVQYQDIYAALPADVNSAVLVLPCLAELPAGEGPTNWEIPLAFVPAPPDLTVFPVEPVSTPVPPAAAAPAETTVAAEITAEPPSPDGWQFTLQNMADLDEGYYLETLLSWGKDPDFYEVELLSDALHLYDAQGEEVSVWLADQIPPTVMGEAGSMPINLQTMPIYNPGPARLVIEAVGVRTFPFASFTLDLGSSPQPGQTWEVNKVLDIEGRSLTVLSAEYVLAGPNEPPLLMLNLDSDSGIYSAIAYDKDHETRGSVGSPKSENVPFRAGWYYAGAFPEGEITVEFSSIVVRKPGPWTLTWTPTHVPTPTATSTSFPYVPGVCADPPQPVEFADLPAGLGGRVAFAEGENFDIVVSNLDGSERIELGSGVMPQISPDGSRITYFGQEKGVYVRALDGSEAVLISGPIQENVFEIWPQWSPDGRQVAFERVIDHNSDVYVVNADGSGLTALFEGPEAESFFGWSADGQRMFYGVTVEQGLSMRELNLSTGQSRDLLTLPFEAMQPKISPDGTRLLYSTVQGVFMQSLDGGEPVLLLANKDNHYANPLWSPDGQWILISDWDAVDDDPNRRALLQPETCQLLRLDLPLGMMITSWVGE